MYYVAQITPVLIICSSSGWFLYSFDISYSFFSLCFCMSFSILLFWKTWIFIWFNVGFWYTIYSKHLFIHHKNGWLLISYFDYSHLKWLWINLDYQTWCIVFYLFIIKALLFLEQFAVPRKTEGKVLRFPV